jgi:hypothetical protein
MSWVTDVLLIFNVEEFFDDELNDFLEEIPALNNINTWLKKHQFQPLDNLDQYVNTGKSMQACVYGGAFDSLNPQDLIEAVKAQSWKKPQNVQLLIQSEAEERFTLYSVAELAANHFENSEAV